MRSQVRGPLVAQHIPKDLDKKCWERNLCIKSDSLGIIIV